MMIGHDFFAAVADSTLLMKRVLRTQRLKLEPLSVCGFRYEVVIIVLMVRNRKKLILSSCN